MCKIGQKEELNHDTVIIEASSHPISSTETGVALPRWSMSRQGYQAFVP